MTEIERPPATLDQLEERWKISRGLLYKMVADGRLKAFHIGKYLRISHDEIERIENGGDR